MARAMTQKLNLFQARKYLADAKRDKQLLDKLKKESDNTLTMRFE